MKIRLSGVLPLVAFAFLPLLAAPALAQVPVAGPSMPLPLVIPIKKVPVGSWSEYFVNDGKRQTKMRVALVARTAKSADVEMDLNSPFPGVQRMVVRLSLPVEDAPEVTPRELVLQLGDAAPMLMPQGPALQKFTRIDPSTRVGVEDIQVPGGKFSRIEHHQDKRTPGQTIDFWITKDVLPFGFIKTVSTSPESGQPMVMELVARGKGAKPAITKKPGPFDPAAIAAAAGMAPPGGGAAPGGVPQRGVPSPHPGMPPTPVGSTPPPAKKK